MPFYHGALSLKLRYNLIVPAKRIIALSLIFAGISILIGFFIISAVQSGKPTAGLKIDTAPPSLVFINDVQVGTTPLDKYFVPGEVKVKLIPNSSSSALSTYQTKVRLTNKVYTVIKRDFGMDENTSSGEIVTLQPQTESGSGLNVVTSGPDSAAVTLDGQPQGFTPLSVASLSPGAHQVLVSAPGYQNRLVNALAISGYKLIINVKLSALPVVQMTPTPIPVAATSSASPAPKLSLTPAVSLSKPYITIKNTPTGFLRVRNSPSLGGTEVGQVKPGDSYPLLDSQSGWYQIKVDFTSTSSGWISSQYAQKF